VVQDPSLDRKRGGDTEDNTKKEGNYLFPILQEKLLIPQIPRFIEAKAQGKRIPKNPQNLILPERGIPYFCGYSGRRFI